MEKKKMKLWKKILIVLFVIFLVFLVMTIPKAMLFTELSTKVSNLEDTKQNIHIKMNVHQTGYQSHIERYIKDDVDKLVMERTNIDGNTSKLMQFIYPEKRILYIEQNGEKTKNVYEEEAPVRSSVLKEGMTSSYTTISNYTLGLAFSPAVIFSSIHTVEMDGKECYEISTMYNPNYIYDENSKDLKIYIEKDTGLPVKVVETIEENGEKIQNTIAYEYAFDCVTDEDIAEPEDRSYNLIT